MIHHSRPTLGGREARALTGIVRSCEIAGGREVERFETEAARYVGVRDACAVNSGTAALHLALMALDVGKGREVIVPSYVCSAVLNAVNYTGARPVLADVEPDTGNIDVAQLRRLVTRRTSAIIVAHMFGLPARIEDALAIGVPVIEDCAMAIGAEHTPLRAGGQGTGRSLRPHPRPLPEGEGTASPLPLGEGSG
ncbi:MAG: aminotransferase class I/II-fold pyridoxal phosphate-dependent enzyme, partial [Planctomycetota bacterium]|nr:aminotransferase class I/II-fold pyridoxal phosphate-dependent enzyme [Planctomycetota bacterium]